MIIDLSYMYEWLVKALQSDLYEWRVLAKPQSRIVWEQALFNSKLCMQ